MAKILLGLYLASVFLLVVSAVGIFRLRCEGFGCMGVGVAWFAWVIAFFVVLAVGWLARSKAAPSFAMARACKGAWWLQLAMGSALVVVWVAKRAA